MIKNRYIGRRRGGFRVGLVGAMATFLIIVTMTLNNTRGAESVGFIAIACALGLSNVGLLAYFSVRATLPSILKSALIAALLFFWVYMVGVVQMRSLQSLTTFVQIILVLGFFATVSLCSWSRKSLQIFAWLSTLFIVAHGVWWSISGLPSGFSGYVANQQAFGPLVYLLLFFVLAARQASKKLRWWWAVISLLGVALVLASSARSVWLAVLASLLTYLSWDRITRSVLAYRLWLVGTFAFLVAFTYLYALLPYHPRAVYWNAVVREYTGENLLSGREDLWLPLIEVVKDRLLLGYGASALPGDFLPVTVSAHNLYLQTALQVGLVGLLLFSCLLWAVWEIYWRGRRDPVVRLAAAFMIGTMVHDLFDPTLTQNNLSLGLLGWLIMGIGVSKSIDLARAPPQKR